VRDGVLTVNAAGGVLANDSDLNGDPLIAQIAQLPDFGTVVLNNDGSFDYTPAPGYIGDDSFQYTAGDGQAPPALATVSLRVLPPVDPIDTIPQAAVDRYQTPIDTPLSIDAASGVLANDIDTEDDPLIASLVAPPRHGTLSLAEDGGFEYRPLAGFHGTDSFTYRADDGNTATAPTVVLVEVLPAGVPRQSSPILAGDANRNGRLDAADVAIILRSQFTRLGMAAYDPAADVDADGRVSIRDAILARNLAGSQASPGAVILQTGAVDSALASSDFGRRIQARRSPVITRTPAAAPLDQQPTLSATRSARPRRS
jgi:hypothetical protein